jgi:hypothetical protein
VLLKDSFSHDLAFQCHAVSGIPPRQYCPDCNQWHFVKHGQIFFQTSIKFCTSVVMLKPTRKYFRLLEHVRGISTVYDLTPAAELVDLASYVSWDLMCPKQKWRRYHADWAAREPESPVRRKASVRRANKAEKQRHKGTKW